MDISAGEFRLQYRTADAGQLRQIGFRPVPAGGSPIESGAFPAEAFPLARLGPGAG
jgi:hypothetical protein